MLTLNVSGLDQLNKNLQALAPELKKKALNNMLVAGGQVVAVEAAARAPRGHEIGPRLKAEQHVADSIRVQIEKHPIGSDAEVYVGPNKNATHKARWLELGTTAHAIVNQLTKRMMKWGIAGKKVLASPDQIFGTHVNHPGEQPRPFMRPALQAAGKDAIEAMKKSLAQSIQDAAKKINGGRRK